MKKYCLFIYLLSFYIYTYIYIQDIIVIKTYVKVKNLDLIENISFIHSAYIYIYLKYTVLTFYILNDLFIYLRVHIYSLVFLLLLLLFILRYKKRTLIL